MKYRDFWESHFWETFTAILGGSLVVSIIFLLIFPTTVFTAQVLSKVSGVIPYCEVQK